MAQQDYILRIIEQLGAALIQLRRAILGKGVEDSEVEHVLRRSAAGVGMDLELARVASPDSLHAMIAPTGEVDPMRAWLMGETLLTDALHQRSRGRNREAREALARARVLFSLVGKGAFLAGYPEAEERIVEIDGILTELIKAESRPS
ncbi:MAG: hypothetical protein HKO53_20040 [Gemmatimonadetes bacterium]|nr:hypothetical protein [Gemmatimonadota bacterium]